MTDFATVMARRKAKQAGVIWADQVVPKLYLGSGQDASNLAELTKHEITHVINVADDVPNFHAGVPGAPVYCSLLVGDFGTDAGISRVFDEAATFAAAAMEGDGNVLVHCANGSNRSASVVIALLMLPPHNMPLAAAFATTKAARRETNPLTDNRRELLQFDAKLQGGTATLTEEEWMKMK